MATVRTPTAPAPRGCPDVPVRHRMTLGVGPGLGDVGRARREVGDWLGGLGLAESADGVGLVLGELAGNALRHAPGARVEVVLGAGGGRVVVEVRDGSPAPPVLRADADPYAETGRGLPLVAAFAADWGWAPGPDGKTTWAVLADPSGYAPVPLPVCRERRVLTGEPRATAAAFGPHAEHDLRCVLQTHTAGVHHAYVLDLDAPAPVRCGPVGSRPMTRPASKCFPTAPPSTPPCRTRRAARTTATPVRTATNSPTPGARRSHA
ncbi:ATP-binding protein [Streptomyces sp. NPDC021224]|uniref:ATP-binding protein n=1 Tax=unclassified Streptomyces TaxID=2593676 RepID=UPI0037929868